MALAALPPQVATSEVSSPRIPKVLQTHGTGNADPLISAKAKHHIPPTLSLFAGGVAGGVEAAATYPFEFAKTRSQLKGSNLSTTNPFSLITQTIRGEGVRAIYTGCSTLVVGTTFKAGVRFLSFDAVRNLVADENGRLSPSRGLLAGMLAGCVESIVAVTPSERVKTAIIDDAKGGERRFNGGAHAFKTIIREQGVAGLYRGLLPTVMKQSATSAVRMGSYNVLRESAKRHNLPDNSLTTFSTGAIAGVLTVYATQPLDTIKTRSQGATRVSTVSAIRDVFSTLGVRGFWRGSTMRLGRLVFSGGIVFTVYENVVAVLTPVIHRS